LIAIGGDFAAGFLLHEQPRSFDPAGNVQCFHRGTQPHINSVRRNPKQAGNVLGRHVPIDKAKAIALAIGQRGQVDRGDRRPYCHSNTPPRRRANVKAVRHIVIKVDAHLKTRPCFPPGSNMNPLRIFAQLRPRRNRSCVALPTHVASHSGCVV